MLSGKVRDKYKCYENMLKKRYLSVIYTMYKEIKYVWRNQDLSSHLNILELLQWAVYLADFKMNLFLNVFMYFVFCVVCIVIYLWQENTKTVM